MKHRTPLAPMHRDRFAGALHGLAVGDAVGTTLEFLSPGSFSPITDMVGGGPFFLQPGEWTDDTSMALCLAESLVVCQGFNAHDQMDRYVRWWKEGYYSVKGYCFDIGGTTATALERYTRMGDPFAGVPDGAGNGSLMRLAPVPMAYANDPAQAIFLAGESSRTTHGAAQARDACRYVAGLLVGAIHGEDKAVLLSERYTPSPGLWEQEPLHPEIDAIAAGSFKAKNPPEIVGKGYVVPALEAALWAFFHSTTFADGCLRAVNLGDDADTTGAIYGQIVGAYYGKESIPLRWREKLAMRERIEELIDALWDMATG